MLYSNKNRRAVFAVVGLFVVIATATIVGLSISQEGSKPVDWQPVNWQTLDPWAVAEQWPTDAGGRYPSSWVTPPLQPVVVRQDHPDGPSYQETVGYTFMLYSMKYPRIARMPDGTIILRAAVGLEEKFVIMFSEDDGQTWSDPLPDPVPLPGRGQLVPLGGQELMCYGHTIWFSKDGGKTWDESVEVPEPEGGYSWSSKGSMLVEGDDISRIQYIYGQGLSGGTVKSVLHHSHDRGRTWEKRVEVPEFHGSEGSIVRAPDGSLVATMRTSFTEEEGHFPTKGIPFLSDHWRGITTYRSTDNGKSWSQTQILNKYGHVHSELLLLNNGDILLTYAARIGELDGQTYHGIEAMLSHDNGKSWDWQNRFILFRCLSNDSMHSPISAQLSDGRILTVFMYHDPMRFCDDSLGIPGIGHVSAVIWSPE